MKYALWNAFIKRWHDKRHDWLVPYGPFATGNKRYRKLFDTREEADAYRRQWLAPEWVVKRVRTSPAKEKP